MSGLVGKDDQNVKCVSLVKITVQRLRGVSTVRLRRYGLTQNTITGVVADVIITTI